MRRIRTWFRRLPVARKLSLGIGIPTLAIAALGLAVILASSFALANEIRLFAEQHIPSTRATSEIEINAAEVAAGALALIETGDTARARQVRNDMAELRTHLGLFARLSDRATTQRLTELTGDFEAAVADARARAEGQIASAETFRALRDSVDALLDGVIQPRLRRGRAERAMTLSEEIEINAGEIATSAAELLVRPMPEIAAEMIEDEDDLRDYTARFTTAVTTPDDRRNAAELSRLVGRFLTAARSIRTRGEATSVLAARIGVTRDRLDRYIDREIQPPAERRTMEAVSVARRTVLTQTAATVAIVLFAAAFALIGSRALAHSVSDPLSTLSSASRRMSSGELGLTVDVDSSPEITELATLFNTVNANLLAARRQIEDALRRAQEANVAKSRFVSDVSHEMRTPLTSLRGSLGLLVNRAVPLESDKAANLLRIALGNTERLIRMINDRLDLDKIEAGQLEFDRRPEDLRSIVADAVRNVQTLAESRGISIRVDGETPAVMVDHDRIVQVLVNLIGNAVKFSPANGTVRVTLSTGPGHARVAVADDGPGIGGDVRDKLFERFRQLQTTETSGGTGLGLAISKAIVREHGGVIDVDSELGRGSTFWFTVPLADAEVRQSATAE